MALGKKTGGRKKGTPNKATADVKALAQNHGETAILTLAEIATDPEQPSAARVAAANSLLDRGYGKPTQAMELTGQDGGPILLWGTSTE
jgi:hypothetical protein